MKFAKTCVHERDHVRPTQQDNASCPVNRKSSRNDHESASHNDRPHPASRPRRSFGGRGSPGSYDPTLRELIAPIVHELVDEARGDVLLVSQVNVEAVLGIPRRTHLEFCRRRDFTPRVIRAGKLRLVDADEYRAWLRRQHAFVADCPEPFDDADDATAVLAELGLRQLRPGPSKTTRRPRDTGSGDP